MVLERQTVHLADAGGSVAIIDSPVRDDYGTGEVQLVRYQYSNHLGTATLELDDSGDIISYEEYYPFGTTSFQSGRTTAEVSLKRYRFTGKERDEETGMYYHGARYYIPWLCRWSAVDPLEGDYTPWSSYNYGFDNPLARDFRRMSRVCFICRSPDRNLKNACIMACYNFISGSKPFLFS